MSIITSVLHKNEGRAYVPSRKRETKQIKLFSSKINMEDGFRIKLLITFSYDNGGSTAQLAIYHSQGLFSYDVIRSRLDALFLLENAYAIKIIEKMDFGIGKRHRLRNFILSIRAGP